MAKDLINKIGILGGSFDPAHLGHLTISKIAINEEKLKRLYWVVAKKNPFKKKPIFSLSERLSRAKNISKNYKNIKVVYLDDYHLNIQL